MENDIRDIWNRERSQIKFSQDSFSKIIQQPSTAPLDKMIRNLKIEHVLNIVGGIGLLVYFIATGSYLWALSVVLLFTPFLIYYQRLLNRIKRIKWGLDIHTYLLECHGLLQAFYRHYRWMMMLGGGLGYLGGIFISLYNSDTSMDHNLSLVVYVFLSMLLLMGAVATYLLIRWFTKKIYGDKLASLEKILEDMERET